MPSNHLHRYRRKGKSKIYFCTKQDCFHRMEAEYLIGKHAECPFCNGEYTLTTESFRRVLPRCQSCTKGKKSQLVTDALSAIQAIFKGKEDVQKEEERVERLDSITAEDISGV